MNAAKRSRTRVPRDPSLMVRMVLVSVLTPLIAIALLALLFVLPDGFRVGVVIALLVGLLSWGASYGRRRATEHGRLLTEADGPELLEIVDRLCAIADIRRPEVRLVNQRQPNSWVVQYRASSPRLYLTTGLIELLNTDEMTAVIGHELSHIANRDALVMSVVGMPSAVMRRSTAGGLGAIFVVLIGAVAEVGTTMLSRYRELAADAGSAAITGRPSALASALMKVSDGLARVPSRDLREAAALNSFNLVAVQPRIRRRRGPVGRQWERAHGRVFASHPPLQARLDALHALERAQHHTD
jgi:heat shock protein HtpX